MSLATVNEVFKRPPKHIQDTITDLRSFSNYAEYSPINKMQQIKFKLKTLREKRAMEYMCAEAYDLEDIKRQLLKLTPDHGEEDLNELTEADVIEVFYYLLEWLLKRLIANKQETDALFRSICSNDDSTTENKSNTIKEEVEHYDPFLGLKMENSFGDGLDVKSENLLSAQQEFISDDNHENSAAITGDYNFLSNPEIQSPRRGRMKKIPKKDAANFIIESEIMTPEVGIEEGVHLENDDSRVIYKEDYPNISDYNAPPPTEEVTFINMSDEGEFIPQPLKRGPKKGVRNKDIKCPLCDFTCVREKALRTHMTKQHFTTEAHTCEQCGNSFRSLEGLNRHIKVIHIKVYDVPCQYCDEMFISTNVLRSHITAKHGETVPTFYCSECDFTTKQKQYLNRHMGTHTGIKPYVCRFEGCGKAFRLSNIRLVHEKRHQNLKEHECNLCPKRFITLSSLKNHIKRHLGQKDYPCETCGRAYVEPAGARKCRHTLQ